MVGRRSQSLLAVEMERKNIRHFRREERGRERERDSSELLSPSLFKIFPIR